MVDSDQLPRTRYAAPLRLNGDRGPQMAVSTERGSFASLETVAESSPLRPDELWDLHGAVLFAMAYALLGDESAAVRAVTLGMADLYKVPDPEPTLRSAAHCVYQQCHRTQADEKRQEATPSAPLMAGLEQVAWFQRSALALCFFGGHTYREAATELDIPADSAAWLLLSGLQELSRQTSAQPKPPQPPTAGESS